MDNRLSLGRMTFTQNLKRYGSILIAVELYTFDQLLGDFLVIFVKKKQRGWSTPPGFDQISLNLERSSSKPLQTGQVSSKSERWLVLLTTYKK